MIPKNRNLWLMSGVCLFCEVITLCFTQMAMVKPVSHSALHGMCESFPFGKFAARSSVVLHPVFQWNNTMVLAENCCLWNLIA